MNMSYCRFKNTSQDLGDCLDAIENEDTKDMADFEYEGLEDILSYCESILEHRERIEEIIEEYKENRWK